MFYIKMTQTPPASKILNQNFEAVFSSIVQLVTDATLLIIKSPGFVPVMTSKLREGHVANYRGLVGEIACEVAYWTFIVFGHKVAGLTTDAQRKWFFANLKAGNITVKGVEEVAPDNYPLRAMVELYTSGAIETIIMSQLGKAMG